jgi:hypothetical protein
MVPPLGDFTWNVPHSFLDLNIAEKKWITGHPMNFLYEKFFGNIFSNSILQDISKMLKYLHFGSVSGKLWPFEDFSLTFFGSKHIPILDRTREIRELRLAPIRSERVSNVWRKCMAVVCGTHRRWQKWRLNFVDNNLEKTNWLITSNGQFGSWK